MGFPLVSQGAPISTLFEETATKGGRRENIRLKKGWAKREIVVFLRASIKELALGPRVTCQTENL